jgi:SAM-dependent methyltransferase
MKKDYSTLADKKMRWAGLLENPVLSKIQRHLLDGFRPEGLAKALESLAIEDVLEVCCGLGEYGHIKPWRYVGMDNSFSRLAYGQRHVAKACFLQGDAFRLSFKDHSFSAVLLACSAHHFTAEGLARILKEMARVSKKYIIVSDNVRFTGQGRVSRFFYDLDRGAFLRTTDELEQVLKGLDTHKIILHKNFKTFPGIYQHAVFVLAS